MSWSSQQLEAISDSNDFHVAPFRDDGETYGTLTYIWSVVVGEAVYIRAYGGTSSSWYQAAISQKAGPTRKSLRTSTAHSARSNITSLPSSANLMRRTAWPPFCASSRSPG